MKFNAAFWKWFGNSRVVDSHGDPLVVYHGTKAKFNVFDIKKSFEGAHFFSASRSHAKFFGTDSEYFLKIENPLMISQDDLELQWDIVTSEDDADIDLLPRQMIHHFIKKAKSAHKDGVIVRAMVDLDSAYDTYLVFKENQIKRVDNDGSWDLDDDDVRSNPRRRRG